MNISNPIVRREIWRLASQIATLTVVEFDPYIVGIYTKQLFHVLLKDPEYRFQEPFEVAKPSGDSRLIRPAGDKLKYIHGKLTEWMLSFPGAMGEDYCYILRQGVGGAIKMHKNLRYAAIYDLKNAFDHVRQVDIEHWLLYHCPILNNHVRGKRLIHKIADLMCFEGRTPQGLTTTPFAFNLVIRPLDQMLKLYCRTKGYMYTRYSDNICISSIEPINFRRLGKYVRQAVRSLKFELNEKKTEHYREQPAHYLGSLIYDGYSVPDIEQQKLIIPFLQYVNNSDHPYEFRKSVTGYWTNTYIKSLGKIPLRLWEPFRDYYDLVGKPPPTFRLAQVIERDITELTRPPSR